MTSFTDKERPTVTTTDVARPTSGKEGRFGTGKFGKARFGTPDGITDVPRPALPGSARADVAIVGQARVDTEGYVDVPRPE